MTTRSRRAGAGSKRKPSPEPDVQELFEAINPDVRSLFDDLREKTLALAGVSERPMWDGLEREWAPAFYLEARQLYHVHGSRVLGVTISIATRTLAPEIVARDDLDDQLKKKVARARDYRGTKWLFLDLSDARAVDQFLDLARFKHRYYTEDPS